MFPSTLPQRSPSTTAPLCVSTTLHVGTFQKCCTWPGSFLEDAESQHKNHLSKWGSGRREVTCPTNTQKGSNRSSKKKNMLFFFSSGLGQTDRHNEMCGCHLAGVNHSGKLQYTYLVVLNCLHTSDLAAPYTDLLLQSFIERINVIQTWLLWTFASRLPAW